MIAARNGQFAKIWISKHFCPLGLWHWQFTPGATNRPLVARESKKLFSLHAVKPKYSNSEKRRPLKKCGGPSHDHHHRQKGSRRSIPTLQQAPRDSASRT